MPRGMLASGRNVKVHDEALLTLGTRVDHRAVSLTLLVEVEPQGELPQRPQQWFSKNALQLTEVQKKIFRLWQLVPMFPDAGWPIDCKEQLFAKLGRMILLLAAHPGRPAPRADWLTGSTWCLVQ